MTDGSGEGGGEKIGVFLTVIRGICLQKAKNRHSDGQLKEPSRNSPTYPCSV